MVFLCFCEIMSNHRLHILHYLILLLVLLSGGLLLFMYAHRPYLQFYIGVGIAISYFAWGVIHHHLLEDLHRKHVVEYGMLAMLGIFLLKVVLQ